MRRGACANVAAVRLDVLDDRPAVDSAGAAAQIDAADGALYTVRSERLFCEQLDYNIPFRWFLDMSLDEESFDHSSFTRNRDRLLIHDVAKEFFRTVVEQARAAGLLSDEHFSVDGTLIEAWASLKTFPPPDDPGNPTVSFHGEQRSNATHESTTDPESKLARKPNAAAAKPSYSQHALIENRNGLLVDIRVAEANGTAECETALEMIGESLPGTRRITVGGDIVGAAYNLLRMSRLLPAS